MIYLKYNNYSNELPVPIGKVWYYERNEMIVKKQNIIRKAHNIYLHESTENKQDTSNEKSEI